MKIYDISQEVFSSEVYPGDRAPRMEAVCRMAEGDLYNLTDFSMCAHNGTHMDAPFHFFEEGRTVEAVPLDYTVGPCYVALHEGELTADDAAAILESAATHEGAERRILLKGDMLVTREAAEVFAGAGIFLLGVESQTVGDPERPMAVHKILLSDQVVLLEGIRLSEVEEGFYFLSAAPLKLGGSDGAPCRAYLIAE